ncbi:MAG: chemotaxis protein CheW [Planctomycetota bacterium]|jgi:chemotaxis signal transduction protein
MSNPIQLCSFRAGDRLCAVPIHDVREIASEASLTVVPHGPDTVHGLVNIRGHIHLILDLHTMLGYPRICPDEHTMLRMLIFKEHCGPAFGILIDSVEDIIIVDSDEIVDRRKRDQAPPAGNDRRSTRSGLVTGVIMHNDELTLVLRVPALIDGFRTLASSGLDTLT